jgi:hypothetical protein
LATSTVREALTFSALLRQPKKTPHHDKVAYVNEVIRVLEMETYADAVVGVPGEGMFISTANHFCIRISRVLTAYIRAQC